MSRSTGAMLAAALVLTGCTQSQGVGFTGIGSEGAGFGTGAVTSSHARAVFAGPPPDAATLHAALTAPPLDGFATSLGAELVEIRRVALGEGVYAVITRPGGAGAVSAQALRIFALNAAALTNCRQAGAFGSDPQAGSVARLSC